MSKPLPEIREQLNNTFDDAELDAFCLDNFSYVYDKFSRGLRKDEKLTLLLDYCRRTPNNFRELLGAIQSRPDALELQPLIKAIESFLCTPLKPARLFIAYKRQVTPDKNLAVYLHNILTEYGHEVFIDQTMRTGEAWMDEVDQQIKASDFLIVLLSEASADSEMVKAEVKRAYDYRNLHGKPQTLPIRITFEGLLPYSIAAFVDPLQYVIWQGEADNEQVAEEIMAAIDGQLSQRQASLPPITETISEDGRPVVDNQLQRPLPLFDPRFIKSLTTPGGVVKLSDKWYIERETDRLLKDEIIKQGTTITIRAPRQTGKTSLLARGVNFARECGANIIFLDFQNFGGNLLDSLELFLREIGESICDELDLDEEILEKAWKGKRSGQKKLNRFIEKDVLPNVDRSIVLAVDEADFLLRTDFYKDFFGLLRSWHNRRAYHQIWDKFNIVLVISTEPYLLIDDINQSPFNVGLDLKLIDFDELQICDLNKRYNSPVKEDELPQLINLLGGHPFLTRRALYEMVTRQKSWAELKDKALVDTSPFSDHLRHQYWIIRDRPELKNVLKEIISTGRCSDEKALFRLCRAGLVKGSGNVYMCRCNLYRLYFKDKLF